MKGIILEIGQKFGKWSVVNNNYIVKNGHRFTKCRCDCGHEQYVESANLVKGRTKSCKHCVAINRRTTIPIGIKSKNWTVIANPILKNNSTLYLVQCKCGNTRYMSSYEFYNPNGSIECSKCAGITRGKEAKIKNGIVGNLDANKYGRIKRIAEKRHISFDVSQEFLWSLYLKQGKKCAITGDDIPDINKASLDRINSNLPYIETNVQWVTKQANLSKHIMSMNELYEFCKKVLNHANQQPSTPLTKCEGSTTNS